MIRSTFGLFAFGAVVLAAVAASAQPPPGGRGAQAPPPPPMTNLQVFPKDTPRPQVVAAMQQFTQALGVRCEYCHVDDPAVKVDMASDDKQTKRTARAMMLMSRDIAARLPEITGKSADTVTRVGCMTCHRGVAIPKQIADIVTEAAASGGATAGLAKFKELRAQYYGGQSYDFSEGSLLAIAQRANAAQKSDDALAYLQANLEYYPKSARTYLLMSQVHNGRGDKDAAIKDVEKAIELDPGNAQAKQALQRLKGAR